MSLSGILKDIGLLMTLPRCLACQLTAGDGVVHGSVVLFAHHLRWWGRGTKPITCGVGLLMLLLDRHWALRLPSPGPRACRAAAEPDPSAKTKYERLSTGPLPG
jgi:hypothetical protein